MQLQTKWKGSRNKEPVPWRETQVQGNLAYAHKSKAVLDT